MARVFESAFRTFFESDEYQKALPKPTQLRIESRKDGRARFPAKGDPIGIRAKRLFPMEYPEKGRFNPKPINKASMSSHGARNSETFVTGVFTPVLAKAPQ